MASKLKGVFFSQVSLSFLYGLSCFKFLFDASEALRVLIFLGTLCWFLSVTLLRVCIMLSIPHKKVQEVSIQGSLKFCTSMCKWIIYFNDQQSNIITCIIIVWFVICQITKQCKHYFFKIIDFIWYFFIIYI